VSWCWCSCVEWLINYITIILAFHTIIIYYSLISILQYKKILPTGTQAEHSGERKKKKYIFFPSPVSFTTPSYPLSVVTIVFPLSDTWPALTTISLFFLVVQPATRKRTHSFWEKEKSCNRKAHLSKHIRIKYTAGWTQSACKYGSRIFLPRLV